MLGVPIIVLTMLTGTPWKLPTGRAAWMAAILAAVLSVGQAIQSSGDHLEPEEIM
jgi:hypothetical protein